MNNNYLKITNPLTNQTFSIYSIEGKSLLKNYIKQYYRIIFLYTRRRKSA